MATQIPKTRQIALKRKETLFMVDEDPPIFKFKPTVECVLTEKGGTLDVLPAQCQKFTIVGMGRHPDNAQPTFLGEIWSGVNDGQRFWLEPGWYERINEWATLD
jgi:hypothetical protein